MKSETTPVQVERGGGEKWAGSEYGFMAEPMAFLMGLEGREGEDHPLLARGTGRVES